MNMSLFNEERARRMRRNSILLIVFGFIGILECAFLITGMIYTGSFKSIVGTLSVFAFIILPFVLIAQLFPRGVRALVLISFARNYCRYFEADEDGLIPVNDCAKALKTPRWLLQSNLRFMVKKGLIRGIEIDDALDLILISRTEKPRWESPSYLNQQKLASVRSTGILWLVLALVFLWYFMSMAVVMVQKYLWVLIVFTVFFTGIFVYQLFINRKLKRLVRYNLLMENCTEDSWDPACAGENADPRRIIREIEWGIRKECVRNCYADHSAGRIMLADVQDGYARFAAVACAHCGVTQKIRAGRIAKCAYCGSLIAAPNNRIMARIGVARQNYGTAETFRNDAACARLKKNQFIFLGIGIFLLLPFILTLAMNGGTFGKVEPRFYYMAPALILIALTLIALGVRCLTLRRNAMVLANLFPQISEESIGVENLAPRMGTGANRLKRIIRSLKRKKILQQCTFDGSTLTLTDALHRENGFYTAACPNCGAGIRMKHGQVSVCSFCGSYLDRAGNVRGSGREAVVTLYDVGVNAAQVLHYLKDLTHMTTGELLQLTDDLPAEVVYTTADGAEQIKGELVRLGANAETRRK